MIVKRIPRFILIFLVAMIFIVGPGAVAIAAEMILGRFDRNYIFVTLFSAFFITAFTIGLIVTISEYILIR
jgi:hypothetical protein